MPYTVNTVGTRYHGHSNSDSRVAACHSCGRMVTLVSYDTRLWFVIFYIPIIPLGRKRIVDECPVCRRHYAVNADEWETRKQLNVSGAMEAYLANPTPENAMDAHQQMMNFHQTVEAGEFRRQISEKFAQNAKLQAYLGDSLSQKGQAQDATAYYQKALALRADLPEARVGVARDHMRRGNLQEAGALLDYLEKPGAAQLYSLEPLETLAYTYVNAGKQEEALKLFQCILAELPAAGQFPRFRKSVQSCEKLLGRKESILPKRKFSLKGMFGGGRSKQPGTFQMSWRTVIIVGIAISVFLGSVLFQNFNLGRHRTVFVVNGFPTPATVEVAGARKVQVARNVEKLDLPEGRHHATIRGPVQKELDFEIHSDFWSRWTSNSVWLLNVGGSALVIEDHVTYKKDNPPPPIVLAHYGKEIERIDHIDHPFVVLPPTVQVSSNSQAVLRHLDMYRAEPYRLMEYFQSQGRHADAAALAEWRIKLQPDDENALILFVSLADKKHVEEVLRAGLQKRPIAIQWHRLYQSLGRTRQWDAWVAVEYDGMLKAEPNNSALLYLRGRVAPEGSESAQWNARAIEADPANPYPNFSLGFMHSSSADWEGARPLFARAASLKPQSEQFADTFFVCRLALEEYDSLEKELRAQIAKKPLDYVAHSQLIDVLLAQSRSTAAANVVEAFQKEERRNGLRDRAAATPFLLRQLFYSGGYFDKLLKSTDADRTPLGREVRYSAMVELGKLQEASLIHPLDEQKMKDPWHFLTMSLAWLGQHDQYQANEWLHRGLQILGAGTADDARAAALFKKDAVLSPENLNAVMLDPKQKAILLAALGSMRAEQRKELFAAARRCNIDRSYPYQLVQRITAAH